MTLPISVFIVTKNEEKHIAKTLESVKEMAEVILVDSGSTDKTVEIAKSYGVKVFEHEWMGYAKQKQYAMEQCSNEWVLNLDGDEAINPQLVAAFKEIIEQDKADSVRFWRNDIFIGKALSSWSKKPNNHRLYKKSKSFFDDSRLAHESATVDGKEVFINQVFDHYGYDSIAAITTKNNNYSTLKADEKFIKNKKVSNLKLILIFPLVFLKEYLLQRKIFSGRRGFILAIMDAYYAFIKEAKLFENHQNKVN
ncbi:glycosyltransferase family 2 protein [Shewanella sp. Isolate7]|uniref:glycosyltransferase family 2 protein n=1 Tax=Shewanella sp. Isolate7 TaxID=2908528 RepID=UPI001EFE1887|nr:glycosyltransferase family 2 protein [Shewanella sp. Isolate7]MCG9723583.1 glycosyltransferase family 2 protein [Shewanella sp. Isolate7]